MTTLDDLKKQIPEIEALLGVSFQDKALLTLAFTHRSYTNENRGALQHNERLEFLGDSVLGLLMADYLYNLMPTTPEGELSHLRSRLVEASACMNYVMHLGIQGYLLMGKGERMNDGRGRESLLSDLFEGVVGALYIDQGLSAVKTFLFDKLKCCFDEIIKTPHENWKAILQDYCQKKYQMPPIYTLLSETGPDHSKFFEIEVEINGMKHGKGHGSSKKEAQQAAAKATLDQLEEVL